MELGPTTVTLHHCILEPIQQQVGSYLKRPHELMGLILARFARILQKSWRLKCMGVEVEGQSCSLHVSYR